MRILYVSQYFPPEMGAPAGRVYELSRAWAGHRHQVTVLTTMPHHPTGIVPTSYRRKMLVRERIDGIDVVRTWIFPAANRGFVRRTASYLSFMVSAIVTGFFFVRRHDVVIATSPQFFVSIAGAVLGASGRGRFVLEIRDLWPDSLIAVGALTKAWAIRALKRLEYYLYRKARHIVVVTQSFERILSDNGVPREKISVITNGVDLAKFSPGEGQGLREALGLNGKFVVAYIGTIGLAHGLEVVLRAAERLRSDEDIVFLLVGEGARRGEIEREQRRMGLENVVFTGEQPRDRIPDFLRAADACLVHLRRDPLFEAVIPSKVFEIMGCGKPIIMGVGGEARELVERAGAGISFESEDEEGLMAAIERLKEDGALRERMGEDGRRFVERHYNREALAGHYLELIEEQTRA